MPPFEFRGSGPPQDRKGQRYRPRQEFTFRYPKPKTAERPLLQSQRERTPELLTTEGGDKSRPKFASLDALSDSEEADMDLSEDSEEESRPRKRRAVGSERKPSAPPAPTPAPKWSNPDPYTSLPPPDESQHKRVDVVKLIRKAKLENTMSWAKETDAVTANDDFISLGMTDGAAEDFAEEVCAQAPYNAPRGPRSMESNGPALASRKRTYDDLSKGFSSKVGKPQRRFNTDGSILHQWKALSGQNATPWLSHNSHNSPTHPMAMLHNEILDFYNWVRPHYFEQRVRQDLIDRLDSGFRKRYGNVQVKPFGSFASGLYLPTADIDLVLLSKAFQQSGRKQFGERKGQIYAFSAFLKDMNIAVPGSIETIAHARVPILKFVDKLTGLRVDLSFDNDSGIIANDTFEMWKQQYPVMPVIVSVIKQFLLLRGLNEVPTGGLGGFSITCVVTSLLQHMPNWKKQGLGSILLEFFHFYGHVLDWENVGIRMNPPGYFHKAFGNRDRLAIQDPNKWDNDISGGTKEIALVLRTFRDAHHYLRRRLCDVGNQGLSHVSILEPLIAANYDEYTEQRFQLRYVFETAEQFARYRVPPPPPPPGEDDLSPPPPPPRRR